MDSYQAVEISYLKRWLKIIKKTLKVFAGHILLNFVNARETLIIMERYNKESPEGL